MRKVRPEAKLKTLPEDVQEELWGCLSRATEGRSAPMTYEEALGWLAEVHGVVSSMAALSYWRGWYGLRRRSERAQARAREATLEWARVNGDVDAGDLERLGQMVFTAECIEGGDVKAYVELMRLRLKQEAQGLEERRVALLEEKARQAEEAKGVLGSELSVEEQNRRLREILQ